MIGTGAVLCDRYRVTRLLGRGGMAEVYLATDTVRQAAVAVKVLREDLAEEPEFRRRFAREAEALSKLDHPNIVRFYSFETDGPLAVIVMDYVPGERTLRTRLIEVGRPLPLPEVTDALHQVGSALQFAHRQGFVHRDVKPANVMLRPDGTMLLADFGIARAMEASTATLGTVGTPAYMSPEQILGQELDQRSDVYSLGVVLFEMAAGRRPFNGDTGTGTTTARRIQDEHLHARPPDAAQVNQALPTTAAGVLGRALAKSPAERWPDVGSLMAAWDIVVTSAVGSDTEVGRCSYCGQANAKAARFCLRCARPLRGDDGLVGRSVVGAATAPSVGPTAVAPPQVSPPQAAARPLTGLDSLGLGLGARRVAAPHGRRLVAWLVDSLIAAVVWTGAGVLLTGVFSTLGGPAALDGQATETAVLLSFVAIAAYFILSWGLAGITPGRALFRQCLVSAAGGKPGVGRACVRYVVMVVLAPLLGLPWWPVLWRADHRGLHDLAAGTWPVWRG